MSGLKWRRDNTCKAHVILVKMFVENKIDLHAHPSSVYWLSPEFQKYSKSVFRAAFSGLKAKYGNACNYLKVSPTIKPLFIIFFFYSEAISSR